MYGFTKKDLLSLEGTSKLVSEVVQINSLKPGDTLGYSGTFIADEEMKIAVVPIGFADGVIRKNTGRAVYINEKPYEIVGNICMDMLFVKVDESVVEHDEVIVIKDVEHIYEIAKFLNTVCHEVMCNISKRVPRLYKE